VILKWSAEFELGIEPMDLTHREFVEQLNALLRLPDDRVIEGFTRLIDHTVAHFGRENAWMREHSYAGAEAHVKEHERVLKVMTAIAHFMETGGPRMGRMVARELADWFRQHARSMDAELAKFLRKAEAGGIAATPATRKSPGVPRRTRVRRAPRPVSSAGIKRWKS